MKADLRILNVLLGVAAALLIAGCPSDTTTSNGDDAADDVTGSDSVALRMQADYATSAVTGDLQSAQVAGDGCEGDLLEQDNPGSPAGADCDGDGAVVQYITPSSFLVAVKRMTLFDTEGNQYEMVPEADTLAESTVIDLTSPAELGELDLPAAVYSNIEAEFYYYELVMPLNDPPENQRIRVYLSDDDFEAEGNLGHHQGDITLVDDQHQELGFVRGGDPWTIANLLAERDEAGAEDSDADPETGHFRGLYGDALQWNQQAFMQGADQDIFLETVPFQLDLDSAEPGTVESITVVFNVADLLVLRRLR